MTGRNIELQQPEALDLSRKSTKLQIAVVGRTNRGSSEDMEPYSVKDICDEIIVKAERIRELEAT